MLSGRTTLHWSPEFEEACEKLKVPLTFSLVFAFPSFGKPLVAETGASQVATGAVLLQKEDERRLHPIQLAIPMMASSKQNCFACEREVSVVVFALQKYRLFILSMEPFLSITDQQALRAASAERDTYDRPARWMEFFARYDFVTEYRKRSSNQAAD